MEHIWIILAGRTPVPAASIGPMAHCEARLATALASGLQTSLPNTALANGTMGHALDYDDFGGFGHPTAAIFPALLALGEHIGATGRDLMEAYIVGCEVGLAVSHATKYNQMDRGFHSTAVIGHLASAEVDQPYLSIVTMYGEPEDPLQGKFSAKYNVAAALVDNQIAIDTFSDEKIRDPNIQETMKKVSNRVVSKAEEGAKEDGGIRA